MTFHIGNGMSSSQLTNSIIFQRGRYTTNQLVYGASFEMMVIFTLFELVYDVFPKLFFSVILKIIGIIWCFPKS